ncbi:MAG: LysR family transcriptional regulator [Selenomonadaceae bacterium]|nr:LysR family transcriptional regulator [Selenomonadaceae bacterium]
MYNPKLSVFLRAAEAGSFNKAAEELFISAPALIKQINSLENELNLRLFERTNHGLSLTKAGESVYRDAKYIIEYSKEAVERAQNAAKSEEYIIRIGASPLTPPHFLPELWQKIQALCPKIKFQIVPFENNPENAKKILGSLGRDIDAVAGLFDETMLSLYPNCNAFFLSNEPFCCAVSLNSPLATKEVLDIKDLYGQKLLIIRKGWSKYVDALREELEKNHKDILLEDFPFYNLRVFNECENSNYLLLAVKRWEQAHPLLKILPVKWDYAMPFGLLHAKNPSEKVNLLLDTLRQILPAY